MKRIAMMILIAAAAIPALSAPSPAATQAWVKKYVAEHAVAAKSAPVIEASTVWRGTNLSLRISFSQRTNAALRVVSSGDVKMPAGVCFAKTAPGLYQNYTNAHCDAITVARCITSLSVSTNSTPWRTNRNWSTYADFAVYGAHYRGFRSGGTFTCVDISNTSNPAEIVVAPAMLSDADRRAILTPPASVSWLALVCGSAFADWVPGDKEYNDPSNPKAWVQHFVWQDDGENADVGNPHVDFTIGESSFSFDLTPADTLPASGGDACSYNPGSTSTPLEKAQGWLDEIGAKLEESGALFPGEWDEILGLDPDFMDGLLSQLSGAISGNSPAKPTCPITGEDPEDPEEPEVPEPPTGGECSHERAVGTCGAWSCAACGKRLDGPTSHSFGNSGSHCAACQNTFRGARCTAMSWEKDDHVIVSGSAGGCICAYGTVWPHRYGSESGWLSDEEEHWRETQCSDCGYKRISDRHSHSYVLAPFTYDCGENKCNTIGTCVCGKTGVLAYRNTHEQGELTDARSEGDENHRLWYACARSGKANMVDGGTLPHVKVATGTYTYGGEKHYPRLECFCGWTGQGEGQNHTKVDVGTAEYKDSEDHVIPQECAQNCGWTGTRSEPHMNFTQALSATRLASDTETCGVCHGVRHVGHRWCYDDNIHFCDNFGGMHLYGVHELDMNDTCYCGYAKGGHTEHLSCSCGACECHLEQHFDAHDNLTGSNAKCDAGWDYSQDRCTCTACQNGHGMWCVCCFFNRSRGWLSICDEDLQGTHKDYVGLLSLNAVDMDDPVLNVGEYALEGAFVGCANLRTFKGNYITNVAEYGFANCFVGCTALEAVQLSSLATAGAHAFDGAFDGCTSLTNTVEFPALADVGECCFSDCALPSVSLPSATNLAATAFAGAATTNLALGSLSSTNAAAMHGGWFFGLPDGAVIRYADTNVVVVVDISGLPDFDFYVATTGSDRNDGRSARAPKRTIDAALLAATNGQSVGVFPGSYPYPEFFASNMISGSSSSYDGQLSPYPVTLASLYGANTVTIDASLCANTNRAVIAGADGATMTIFDGLTFKGCAYAFTPKKDRFLYAYFHDCVFDGLSSTAANNRSIWWSCVLDGCRVRNSTFSAGVESASNPEWWQRVFGACVVTNSVVEFAFGGGVHQLSYLGEFRDSYISWDGTLSGFCSRGWDYQTPTVFDGCTIVGEVSTNVNASAKGRMYASLTNCIVAVDGLFDIEGAHYAADSSVVTNKAAAVSNIDPATHRATGDWSGYGYHSQDNE